MFGDLDHRVSIDPNYYDRIITIIHLQALKSYEYSVEQQQYNQRKILLVDDEPDILHASSNYFTSAIHTRMQSKRCRNLDLIIMTWFYLIS